MGFTTNTSASSTDFSQLQFRLNTSNSGSGMPQ